MLPSTEYLLALGLTCLVEVPLFAVGVRALGWIGTSGDRKGLRWWQAVVLAVVINLVTHPVLWTVALRLTSTGGLLLAETGVVVIEAAVTWLVVRREPGWALLLCLGTNAASLLIGLLVLPTG